MNETRYGRKGKVSAMQLYIPFSHGVLAPSIEETLKESGMINCIELPVIIEESSIKRHAGVLCRLHNPQREFNVDLSDSDFIDVIDALQPQLLQCIEHVDAISFHLGFTRIHQQRSASVIFENAVSNINYLCRTLKKRILFETPCYREKHMNTGIGDVFDAITNPVFIRSVVGETECGFLLDIAHAFITGSTKEKLSGKSGYAREYFDELLMECAPGIEQIHINAPTMDSEGHYTDAHSPIEPAAQCRGGPRVRPYDLSRPPSPSLRAHEALQTLSCSSSSSSCLHWPTVPTGCRILEMLTHTVRQSSNLTAITLEISSDSPHVFFQQAALIRNIIKG